MVEEKNEKGKKEEEDVIELNQEVKVEPTRNRTKAEMVEAGIGEDEIKMAEEQNMIISDEEAVEFDKKLEESKKEDKKEEKKDEKESKSEKPPKDDKKGETKKKELDDKQKKEAEVLESKIANNVELTPEEEHKHLGYLDRRGQGQYFRMKKEIRKRQELQSKNDFLEMKLKALDDKINAISNNKEEIDDDELDQPAMKKDIRAEVDKKTKEENEKLRASEEEAKKAAREIEQRWNDAEVEGRAAEPDEFDYRVDLATKVMKEDTAGVYRAKMYDELMNPKGNVIQLAYKLAKLHPDYQEDGGAKLNGKEDNEGENDTKDKGKEKIDRMLKNSQRNSSASLSRGTGKRRIAFKDITQDDAADMTFEQWSKLPKEEQERLMGNPDYV